jgi:membrane protease YdiL (CAAX protease family)
MPASPAVVPFIAIAVAFAWLLQGPTAVMGMEHAQQGPWGALAGLGIFGPVVASAVAVRLEGGRVRDLWKSLFRHEGSPVWLVVGLFLPAAMLLVGALVYRAVGGDGIELAYPPRAPERMAALVVMPLVEEIGWRAFLLPRLLPRMGPVKATVVVGLVWCAWHVPMFWGGDPRVVVMLLSLALIFSGSFVFTWLMSKTRGTALVAVMFHAGAHLSNPTLALPGNMVPIVVVTTGYVVLAVLLLAIDRRAWRVSP